LALVQGRGKKKSSRGKGKTVVLVWETQKKRGKKKTLDFLDWPREGKKKGGEKT